MRLRSWGNAFAVAGLVVAVGLAVAQAPVASPRYWVSIGVAVGLAVIAIVLLRPRAEELEVQQLMHLRTQTTDRDIAFLLAGTKAITFPVTLSQHSTALAPFGVKWSPESKEAADARAGKLIALGLMEPRSATEVETSARGAAIVALDRAEKAKRSTTNNAGYLNGWRRFWWR
jgi:hypothetical protein